MFSFHKQNREDPILNFKDFQDYVEVKVGEEIDTESWVDPVTKLEKDDKRIVFPPKKRCLMNQVNELLRWKTAAEPTYHVHIAIVYISLKIKTNKTAHFCAF